MHSPVLWLRQENTGGGLVCPPWSMLNFFMHILSPTPAQVAQKGTRTQEEVVKEALMRPENKDVKFLVFTYKERKG